MIDRSAARTSAVIGFAAAMLALAACGGSSSYNSVPTATSAPATSAASASPTLASPATTSAAGRPSITISPSRGPCDGTIEVTLTGFAPNTPVRLDIARPQSGDTEAPLDPATTDASGNYSARRILGEGGCAAAKKDARITVTERREFISILAGFEPDRLNVAARAPYTYTSTEASTVASAPTIPSTITLTSDAFANNATIPVTYSCNGGSTSPPLAWSGAPAGTKAFALIVHDPDAPLPGGFTHWIVVDLPASVSSLQAAVPAGAAIAGGGTQLAAYRGMCPPPGAAAHHYHFRLYALDAQVGAASGTSKTDIEAAMQGHILAQTDLVGLFSR